MIVGYSARDRAPEVLDARVTAAWRHGPEGDAVRPVKWADAGL